MNYSQGFYNMKDYMRSEYLPPYYVNMKMPVMGVACMDNIGNMPFIPDTYIPTKSNIPMPNGDIPAIPNRNMPPYPTMPKMPNTNMPTYPTMPEMPNTNMPTYPTMPEMPNMNMPTYPTMPEMPNMNMPTYPTMPEMPNMNMPAYPTMPEMPNTNMPTYPTMPGMPSAQMNCKQLYECIQRMHCMNNLNNIHTKE
jgi:hypothetical protein